MNVWNAIAPAPLVPLAALALLISDFSGRVGSGVLTNEHTFRMLVPFVRAPLPDQEAPDRADRAAGKLRPRNGRDPGSSRPLLDRLIWVLHVRFC